MAVKGISTRPRSTISWLLTRYWQHDQQEILQEQWDFRSWQQPRTATSYISYSKKDTHCNVYRNVFCNVHCNALCNTNLVYVPRLYSYELPQPGWGGPMVLFYINIIDFNGCSGVISGFLNVRVWCSYELQEEMGRYACIGDKISVILHWFQRAQNIHVPLWPSVTGSHPNRGHVGWARQTCTSPSTRAIKVAGFIPNSSERMVCHPTRWSAGFLVPWAGGVVQSFKPIVDTYGY